MTSYLVEIAGIRFAVHPAAVGDLCRMSGTTYHGFTSSGEGATFDGSEIPVRLTTTPFPEGLFEQVLFDSGDAQTWYRDSDNYLIDWRIPSDGQESVWTARLAHDASSVNVYCGPQLQHVRGEVRVIDCPFNYPLDQLVTMVRLAGCRGAIHHATGGLIDGRCYLFPGRSTAGKSTLAGILRDHGSMEVLNDDRVITRHIHGKHVAFGTPWPGEAGIALNVSAPLAGIFFLTKAPTNRLEKLTPSQTVERLLPVTSVPWFDPALFLPITESIEQLAQSVPAYDLHFTRSADTAEFVETAIRREA